MGKKKPNGSRTGKKTKQKVAPRPEWDSTMKDDSNYKLSADEQSRRKDAQIAAQAEVAQRFLREKQAVHSAVMARENAEALRAANAPRQMNDRLVDHSAGRDRDRSRLMREILYGDEKRGLQEALRGESKVREVLEELFNDEGLKFTSEPEMTAAPLPASPVDFNRATPAWRKAVRGDEYADERVTATSAPNQLWEEADFEEHEHEHADEHADDDEHADEDEHANEQERASGMRRMPPAHRQEQQATVTAGTSQPQEQQATVTAGTSQPQPRSPSFRPQAPETIRRIQPHKFSAYTMKILAVVDKLLGYLNESEARAEAQEASSQQMSERLAAVEGQVAKLTAGLDQVSELRGEVEMQKQIAAKAEAHRQRLEHRLATLEVHGTGVGGGVINPHTPAGIALLRNAGSQVSQAANSAPPSIAESVGAGYSGSGFTVRDALGGGPGTAGGGAAASTYSMASPLQQHHLLTALNNSNPGFGGYVHGSVGGSDAGSPARSHPQVAASAASGNTPLRYVPNHIPSLQDRLAAADAAIRNLGVGAGAGARAGAAPSPPRTTLDGVSNPFLSTVSPLKDAVVAASRTTGLTIDQLLTPGGYRSASIDPPSTAAANATGAAAALQQQPQQQQQLPYQFSAAHALAQFSSSTGGPPSSASDPLRAAASAAFGTSL
eukprot:gene4945-5263_t